MYPIRGPGTPDPGTPGGRPKTLILPAFSFLTPTIHDNNVVFPHPEAPNNPYLRIYVLYKFILGLRSYVLLTLFLCSLSYPND